MKKPVSYIFACLAIVAFSACNQSPEPPKDPTVITQPTPEDGSPSVKPQWFWEASVWEKTGAIDPWLKSVIVKDNPWIGTGSTKISNLVQTQTNNPLVWESGKQTWLADQGISRISVPFSYGGIALSVDIKPTWWFAFSSHTFEIKDASVVALDTDPNSSDIIISSVIHVNRDSSAGTLTTFYQSKSDGLVLRSVSTPGPASTLQIQSLSRVLTINSVIAVPICTAPSQCGPLPKIPAKCFMATNGDVQGCTPIKSDDVYAGPVIDCNALLKAKNEAWAAFQRAARGLFIADVKIAGTCGGSIIAWAGGNVPIAVIAAAACLDSINNRVNAAQDLEKARETAKKAEEEYVKKCT